MGGVGYFWFNNQNDPSVFDTITQQFLVKTFISFNKPMNETDVPGPNWKSTIMILSTKEKASQNSMDWVRELRKKFDDIDKYDAYTIDLIGFDTLNTDMVDGTMHDLEKMDIVSVPIAAVIFILILRSIIAVILPGIAVVTSICVSFAIMTGICKVMDIPSFCPAICMSIIMAMSIDYCLFLLTRFHEELSNRNPPMVAARNMLRYSGETIAKSGLVFLICLASLIFFPLKIIKAVGIGACIALATTMLVCLTLVPTVVLVGLPIFSIRGIIPCITRKDGKFQAQCIHPCDKNAYRTADTADDYLSKKEKFEKEKRSFFFRWANWMTTVPRASIVALIVIAIMLPFCCGMIAFEYVMNQNQVLPRGSDTHHAINRFSRDWNVGQLYSFDVICVRKNRNLSPMFVLLSEYPYIGLNDTFFEQFHQLALDIAGTGTVNMSGILSPVDLGETYVDINTAYFLMNMSNPNPAYWFVLSQMLNINITEVAANPLLLLNATAVRMTLAANENPNENASKLTVPVRDVIDDFNDHTDYDVYLASPVVDMYDAIKYTYKYLPLIISIIIVIIIVMVVVAFQAPLLALQMCFAIAFVVVWGYGVVSVIFATDWFHGIKNINDDPGLNWIIPVLPLPVLIGIALDYNIFLFTRVHEFRAHGWAPRAALVRGVSKSTLVILSAGLIMAAAFSGLMTSGLMIINQFGVLLFLCVLLDTFLITTTLNPACIFLMKNFAYWWRKFEIKYENPEVFNKDAEIDTRANKPVRDIAPIAEATPLNPGGYEDDVPADATPYGGNGPTYQAPAFGGY